MKRMLTIIALLLVTIGTGVASAATLKPVAAPGDWGSSPIWTTAPPNDPRLFVVERGNPATHTSQIRIYENGALNSTPFLTVPNVALNSERGLLSMAFAPDYATSGLFYVFWVANGPDTLDPTGAVGDIRIVEFKRSASDPNVANPASARLVLKTAHSAGNHDGGWMGFGPDDNLYFTIGDNNTFGAASSDLTNLFGKVMRINPADPAGPDSFTIPADNPFPAATGQNRAIYTIGLRNPFRAAFAPDGNLTVADVGEVTWEEINVGDLKGKNLGWPDCEGPFDLNTTDPCSDPSLTTPFFSYRHEYKNDNPSPGTGNVIIGGHVIRDPDLTGLTGRYLFGDNNRNDLRTINLSVPGGAPVDPGLSVDQYSLLSFGEDGRGCSYVMANGTVFRIAADAAATAACPHVADVPDPPDPEVDTTRPSLALDSNPQTFGKKISFSATCSEKCTISGKGSLKAKRRGKRKAVGFRYTAAAVDAAAKQKVKVVLRLAAKPLKNARKVLRSGRNLNAVLVATAADPSGNEQSSKFTVKIRRAPVR